MTRQTGRLIVILLVTAIGAIALVASAAGSDVLDIRHPEERIVSMADSRAPLSQDEVPLAVPSLQSGLGELAFTDQHAGATIATADQRPVGQIVDHALVSNATVHAAFPEQWVDDGEMVGFNVLAFVRYATDDGHTVVVVTARPTTAVRTHPLLLGDTTVELADGTSAWTLTDPSEPETPNQVTFERNGLLVSVASDLGFDALREFASQVVVE